ncbi:MAG TPA: sodium:solute symporter family protein [Methylophaga sp.]|nr:sodium:solute symporter family protein [Methylophaga sp.]HEC59428.1 sodium:solute symporter family protein [Methylophaga sp.]
MAVFFAVIIFILHKVKQTNDSFTEYAVAGRSFGAKYQAMSFLNTWYPGAMFTAFAGLAAASGVISFYVLTYSLLTVVLMYVMAKPVWVWGKAFDLKTQPDLLALRYNSRHIRTVTAVIGILSGIPWLILGMQALGVMFVHLSFGKLSFSMAVLLGVFVIVIRQFWTVRLGMRGVIISDMFQGIVAYIGGSLILIGLIMWMMTTQDITLNTMDSGMFTIPSIGSEQGPLWLFSLVLTGAIGGWCWPYIFVRLFTADGVKTLKKSAAIAMPLSLIFCVSLLLFGMYASGLSSVEGHAEDVWFIVTNQAGGPLLLGLAGVIVLAATMGHTDGNIQAYGAQIANDLIGNYLKLDPKQLIIIAKVGMVIITIISAWLATMTLPALFALAVMAYQGIIQIAVPQFMGLFWKKGNKQGAIVGMTVGFITAVFLEFNFPESLPWAYGLTSGTLALVVNMSIYVLFAYLLPNDAKENQRLDTLFNLVHAKPNKG